MKSPSNFRKIGDVSDDVIRELRFRRNVERLQKLGPRAIGELLAEIGAAYSIRTDVENRLERYAVLTPEQVMVACAYFYPETPIHAVEAKE